MSTCLPLFENNIETAILVWISTDSNPQNNRTWIKTIEQKLLTWWTSACLYVSIYSIYGCNWCSQCNQGKKQKKQLGNAGYDSHPWGNTSLAIAASTRRGIERGLDSFGLLKGRCEGILCTRMMNDGCWWSLLLTISYYCSCCCYCLMMRMPSIPWPFWFRTAIHTAACASGPCRLSRWGLAAFGPCHLATSHEEVGQM